MIVGDTPSTAQLAPAVYTVTVKYETQTKTQQVTILSGQTTTLTFDFTKTEPKSFGARTIGPFGIPSALLHELWKLREKTIRKEVHKKLHPLV